MKLALWVVRRNRPFAIVADAELIEILTDLNNKVIVPSPTTLSRDVREIFNMSRLKVASILQVCFFRTFKSISLELTFMQSYPGRLHLCVDGWTSPNVIAFLGATVHWVVDGRMQSLILDFIKYVDI
jgi:hypothetical protein